MAKLTLKEIEEKMYASNPNTNPNGSSEEFFKYALMGAKQGSAKCMSEASVCYSQGFGTKEDSDKAIEWAEKGASLGNDFALFLMGTYYDFGKGVEQDYEKANEYYSKAVDLNYPAAKANLACMYADGRGCEVDQKKSFELWLEAYNDGEIWCSQYLFECYLYGLGVDRNKQNAEKYLDIAQANGFEIDDETLDDFYLYQANADILESVKAEKSKYLSDEEFETAVNKAMADSKLGKKSGKIPFADKQFVLPGRQELTKYFNDEIIDFFKYQTQYRKMGINTVPATLLYGPPGCGKTHAVAAVTKFLGMPVFEINSLTVGCTYIHGTSKKIAKIFDEAKKAAPSVVVIDEFETFVGKRDADDWKSKLEETDEFLRNISPAIDSGVVIFAMTNMREAIDPAILRKGRFDNQIEVGPASTEEIKAVLKYELSKTQASSELDLNNFAKRLVNRPLSDIGYVVRQAIRSAVHNGHSKVQTSDLNNGYNDLVRGEAKHLTVPHHHIGFQTA